MPRRVRIPAVCLALLGQLVGLFGLPVLVGHESPSDAPVTACGCSAADRDAGLCCCHQPALPPCCAKKAAIQQTASCCHAADRSKARESSHDGPAVHWVNSVLRQKCHGDAPTATGEPLVPSVAPDSPLCFGHDADPVGLLVVPDTFPVSTVARPDVPPPRPIERHSHA